MRRFAAMKQLDVLKEVRRVLNVEGSALLDLVKKLEESQSPLGISIEKAVRLLQGCLAGGGKIVLSGVGKSGKIAQKISATLCSTGSLSIYLHPTEALHGDLGLLREGDLVWFLSQSGNTEEVLRLLPALRSRGIQILGVGGNQASVLASHCDVWVQLDGIIEACPNGLAPTTSTTLALALGDALAVALMGLRGFDSSHFAQNHPGGGLGKRLNLRVLDLMHRDPEVPYLSEESPMEEVVLASNEKKLGAVLIVHQRKLLGIITDGDLRRSLKLKEKFFSLKAKDVMVRQPVTASPEMMAYSALELMENRPSQISVLPVVDSQGSCLGLIRLHDLVKNL